MHSVNKFVHFRMQFQMGTVYTVMFLVSFMDCVCLVSMDFVGCIYSACTRCLNYFLCLYYYNTSHFIPSTPFRECDFYVISLPNYYAIFSHIFKLLMQASVSRSLVFEINCSKSIASHYSRNTVTICVMVEV